MKTIIFVWLIFLVHISFAQNSEIEGVLNNSSVTPAFNKGQEAIKTSIKDNLFNLNLYEYAHALNELYELMSSNEVTKQEWNNYIDTLLFEIRKEKTDTISPYYAADYKGVIPLQAEFFIASLELNEDLKIKYTNEYSTLKKSTSKLLGLGYSQEEIDSLLVIFPQNSTTGTVNFWCFLQVKGCYIIDIAIKKEGVKRVKMLLKNLDITSTYKVPLYLQVRKYNSLKKMLSKCSVEKMEKIEIEGTILDRDNDKDYYKNALKEGFDMDKMKIF